MGTAVRSAAWAASSVEPLCIPPSPLANHSPDEIGYEVLCRRHHRRRMTAASATAAALSPDVLPVETGAEEAPGAGRLNGRPTVRS